MIQISKQESFYLREVVPEVHITILNKRHSNKRYWAEESPEVLRAIERYRSQKVRKP